MPKVRVHFAAGLWTAAASEDKRDTAESICKAWAEAEWQSERGKIHVYIQ